MIGLKLILFDCDISYDEVLLINCKFDKAWSNKGECLNLLGKY